MIFCFCYWKNFKVCSRSNIIFRGLLSDIFFLVKFISFVKRKANSTIDEQKCKGHEKRDQLLVSKVFFFFRFPSGIKTLPIDPVFQMY